MWCGRHRMNNRSLWIRSGLARLLERGPEGSSTQFGEVCGKAMGQGQARETVTGCRLEIALVEEIADEESQSQGQEQGFNRIGVVNEAVVHMPEVHQFIESSVLQIPTGVTPLLNLAGRADWSSQ